ncbi:nose resistant to fluoxetine protein 6 [Halyomorpha halys]|uniref:nose resistant to fluoxetine protein 6 n=1 Tax=Halyomorpha halys TaxID=286706 RepID=UPI0034D1E551
MLAVFFMAFVLPFIGSGPLWKNESYERSKICSKYWWVHLTYIGNYLHADKLCLIPAWYLACDMQLFLLSVIFFWVVIFFGNFHGIFRFYIRYLCEFYTNKEYLNIYSSTFTRSSPYLIGMVSAYTLTKMKKNCTIIPFVESHFSYR